MHVRRALPSDAEAMSAVLIASITELCTEDHGGRPEAIAEWTANKEPGSIRSWFDNPHGRLFVAEDDSGIVGVGGFNEGGEVMLNYVAPPARFRGISRAMLAHIEAAMKAEGIREARLQSTATAHRLYLAAGWRDRAGDTSKFFNVRCQAMTKTLA